MLCAEESTVRVSILLNRLLWQRIAYLLPVLVLPTEPFVRGVCPGVSLQNSTCVDVDLTYSLEEPRHKKPSYLQEIREAYFVSE